MLAAIGQSVDDGVTLRVPLGNFIGILTDQMPNKFRRHLQVLLKQQMAVGNNGDWHSLGWLVAMSSAPGTARSCPCR